MVRQENRWRHIAGAVTAGLATLLLAIAAGSAEPLDIQPLRDLAGPGKWTAYPHNPVLRPGDKGAWDAGALGSMTVLKVGDGFHMYYEAWGVRGNSGADYNSLQIGHATSRDGVHWEKDPANPVLTKGTGNDWDRDGTWDPFVIHEDGVFKMWYGGGMDSHCDWGYATSTDGVHFEKKGQLSHLGDVEDCHVVHDQATGRYYMYYWDRIHEPAGLFRAQSPTETDFDFAHAAPVEIKGLAKPAMYKFTHVIRDGGQWHMFFAKFVRPGCKGCHTSHATSPDGLHWTTANLNILVGQDGEVLKLADDLWLMFYGPDGFFDQRGCDIRVALFNGTLAAMAAGGQVPESPPFLYAAEGAKKILSYDSAGKVAWEYPAGMSRDVWRLPNGNVLFCYNDNYETGKNDNPSGVMEVTPDKKVVFHFKTTGQVWSCQRLANGNTLVGNASQGKLVVVDPRGVVVTTISLRNPPGHSCLRYARGLPNGNYLVAEESSNTVREYDAQGGLVREIPTKFPPFAAVRLANGNTVISGQSGIVEVDPAGKDVWQLNASDLPEVGIRWFAGVQVLPGGNLLVCNAGGKVPVFEINREKHVVWQSTEPLPLGHGVQRLDVTEVNR